MKLPSLATVRKAVVSVLGVASMAVASGFLHGRVLLDVEAAVGLVTAALTYVVPNGAPKPAATIDTGPGSTALPPVAVPAPVSPPVPGTAPAI